MRYGIFLLLFFAVGNSGNDPATYGRDYWQALGYAERIAFVEGYVLGGYAVLKAMEHAEELPAGALRKHAITDRIGDIVEQVDNFYRSRDAPIFMVPYTESKIKEQSNANSNKI
jgi:hypothetical protein